MKTFIYDFLRNLIIVFSLYLISSFTGASAQKTFSPCGTTINSGNGNISYTVGQTFFTKVCGPGGSASAGVQQTYDISDISVDHTGSYNFLISVFPNPAQDNLILKIENYTEKDLDFQLYDINGKILDSGKIVEIMTSINISKYPSSSYFIKIHKGNKELKIFKIIKN